MRTKGRWIWTAHVHHSKLDSTENKKKGKAKNPSKPPLWVWISPVRLTVSKAYVAVISRVFKESSWADPDHKVQLGIRDGSDRVGSPAQHSTVLDQIEALLTPSSHLRTLLISSFGLISNSPRLSPHRPHSDKHTLHHQPSSFDTPLTTISL